MGRNPKDLDLGTFFSNVIIVVYLLTQCFDGIFTYVGVVSLGFGLESEANPVVAWYMANLGYGLGIIVTKTFGGGMGVLLHLYGKNLLLTLLVGLYIKVAILPWMWVFFSPNARLL